MVLVARMGKRVGCVPKGVRNDDPHDGLNSVGYG